MSATAGLEHAFASTRGILANITPDDYDTSTPCESWKVRDLVNHFIGASQWAATSVTAGESPPYSNRDFTGGNLVDAYDDATKAAVAAFGADGAQEKMVKLPFGTLPGSAFMGIVTTDQFIHGWDLAKATGQPSDIDPAFAAQLLDGAKASISDQFRGPDGKAPFGAAVNVDDSAPPADQLAGFLGRTP